MQDLFDNPELLPQQVQDLLTNFGECGSYDRCEVLQMQINPLGYTFDIGLDGEPCNLRKL